MKARDAKESFQQLQKNLRDKTPARMYLLYGEDRFLRNFSFKRVCTLLGADPEDMNTTVLEGKSATQEAIIEQAETLPFFAEKRVILIKESELVQAGSDKLADYLKAPCETTYFVFLETVVTESCKLYKTLKAGGLVAQIDQQDRAYLEKNMGAMLTRGGKQMSRDAVNRLLDKTGNDLGTLYNEMEKLMAYCKDRDTIGVEDVETICSRTVEEQIFELIDKLAEGNLKRMMELYEDLLAMKEPPMKLITMLEKQYILMLQIKDLREQGEIRETITSWMITPTEKNPSPRIRSDWQVRLYMGQASRYSLAQLQEAVRLCAEADAAVKSGRMVDTIALESLLLQMVQLVDRG